jgi:hypothetical protein
VQRCVLPAGATPVEDPEVALCRFCLLVAGQLESGQLFVLLRQAADAQTLLLDQLRSVCSSWSSFHWLLPILLSQIGAYHLSSEVNLQSL